MTATAEQVVIIDYGSGNLRSAEKAFERMARDRGDAIEIHVTGDAERVARADRIVLPGVGAFGDCRRGLDAVPGMVEALREAVIDKARPFLGICVGMQLMATRGLEHGVHSGLDWIGGEVKLIHPEDRSLKVPHMGWNELTLTRDHPVFDNLGATHAYFVHSYHFVPDDPADLVATTDYAQTLTAAIARDNMVGTQFHPEKSQTLGLALIGNFLRWKP